MAPQPKNAWTGILGQYGSSAGAGPRRHGLVDANPAERIDPRDENEAGEPDRGRRQRQLRLDVDRAIGVGLQLASTCFVLLALFFIAESL
jgi:hypothetical protein